MTRLISPFPLRLVARYVSLTLPQISPHSVERGDKRGTITPRCKRPGAGRETNGSFLQTCRAVNRRRGGLAVGLIAQIPQDLLQCIEFAIIYVLRIYNKLHLYGRLMGNPY